MLHVHDLVDNVSKESLLAGKCASMYANGVLDTSSPFDVVAGEGIRYVVPQRHTETARSLTQCSDCRKESKRVIFVLNKTAKSLQRDTLLRRKETKCRL